MARRGLDPGRVVAEACHGLAAAVDRDPDAPEVPELVEDCVHRVAPRLPPGAPVYVGLACTHYGFIAETFRAALGRLTGSRVVVLDPGDRLIGGLVEGSDRRPPDAASRPITVEVVSKVPLAAAQRQAVARRLETLSAATAAALLQAEHRPDLF
jgi:glutamate racemase